MEQRIQRINDPAAGNALIEKAIECFYADSSRENLIAVLGSIRKCMHQKGQLLLPMKPPRAALKMFCRSRIRTGETFTFSEDMHNKLHHLKSADGKHWLPAFTNLEECEKGESCSAITGDIRQLLISYLDMSGAGIIINPWGKAFNLTRELIRAIFLC